MSATTHILDRSATPPHLSHDGLFVAHHNPGEREFEWDPANTELSYARLDPSVSENGEWVTPKDIKSFVEKHQPLGINVLSYLLAHPELIPEEWKSREIFFLGTIYTKGGCPEADPYWAIGLKWKEKTPYAYDHERGFLYQRDPGWTTTMHWLRNPWVGNCCVVLRQD